MSLSFVSKAVLTAKEGGDGYEEKEIESKEGDNASSNSRHTSQPLFEQLRANKEKEEAEREEFQRSIMRGTMALDEEDAAHLSAIQRQKQEREQRIAQQTNEELAAFRAARELRQLEAQQEEEEEDVGSGDNAKEKATENSAVAATAATSTESAKPKFPQIIVRKKKRRTDKKDSTKEPETKKPKQQLTEKESSNRNADDMNTSGGGGGGGLGSLFADYGSDSDSD